MLIIKVNRINENGSKTPITLYAQSISFTGPYIPKTSKEPDDKSCAIALNNGVVMRIDRSEAVIEQMCKNYRG